MSDTPDSPLIPTDEVVEPDDRPGYEGEIVEPDNSTVDDWLGQSIARDEQTADRLVAETDDWEEAERRFDEEAEGEDIHRAGYPRPGREEEDRRRD